MSRGKRLPGFSRWSCPTISPNARGRIRAASGWKAGLSSVALAKEDLTADDSDARAGEDATAVESSNKEPWSAEVIFNCYLGESYSNRRYFKIQNNFREVYPNCSPHLTFLR